jgi:Secretion system C-terminal sorting domain
LCAVACIENYPTGAFPSWYRGAFVNDNALPLCRDLNGTFVGSSDQLTAEDVILLSANAFEQEEGITVFPNPASDVVKLSAGTLVEAGTVELMNVLGQSLAKSSISASEQVQFNLVGLKGGIYLVRYTTASNTSVKHLIVK